MDAELTIEGFSAYLKDLGSEGNGSTFNLGKACAFSGLRLQLDNNPPSQKTLDECLLIGLSSLSTHSQHIAFVVAELQLLLHFGAKWDSSTLFDLQRTPYHIICQCPSDPYDLLDEMIKCSGGKLINQQDSSGCTAVMYAVHNKNVECLRCLITHGADLNLRCACNPRDTGLTTALIEAIRAHVLDPSSITRDILNLLLDSGADVYEPCDMLVRSPIKIGIDFNRIELFEKLVQTDAQFALNEMWWFLAAANRSIDILGSLINLGVSKNATDSSGRNALHHAVCSGDIDVIRYLLELGVTLITTCTKEEQLFLVQYYQMQQSFMRDISWQMTSSSKMDTNVRDEMLYKYNPCLQAISMERLDVVQLLEKCEQHTFQSIEALKCAVRKNSLKIVNYLLLKYTYPLNIEYRHIQGTWHCSQTIITEACKPHQLKMVTLLMEYGADPVKKSDAKTYQSALMIAIKNEYNELVAHFIRSGVDLDGRLHDEYLGDVLPFEYAVIKYKNQAAEVLLHAGCSCGKFTLVNNIPTGIRCSIKGFQMFVTPELEKLMIEWDVPKNNVMPLLQLSRKSILKHLCPRAVKKISELPLPSRIIRYLSIPELE